MSATKEWIETYNAAFNEAWEALEDAIVKLDALNDQLYGRDGEIKALCPRADASLLLVKSKEIQSQISTMQNAREPQGLPPILPGELRLV